MTLTLVLLLLYAAGLVAVGIAAGRMVRGSGDFFVAGRKLPWGLVSVTLLAANIGAGSTVGAAGLGYRHGLSAWWWVGSAGIGSILLGVWIAPRMTRIATDHGQLTVGDYLEWRYDRSLRGMVSAVLWLASLAGLSGQLIAMAAVLQVAAGVSKTWGCLLGGLIVIVYFSAGGLLSSVWVNLLELAVLLIGFVVVAPYAIARAGGLAAVVEPAGAAAGFDSMVGAGPAIILGWLVVLVPSFMVSPGLIQKTYGAGAPAAARRAVLVNAAALLLFAFIPPLLGMSVRALRPDLGHPDLALPTLMAELLPAALGGLVLAAVFAAEISSADAFLFMLSTSLSRDLYQSCVRPAASDQELLRMGRLAAVVAGALAVGLAAWLPGVIGALTIFYGILTVALFAPLVVGLSLPRRTVPQGRLAIPCAMAIAGGAQLLGRGAPVSAWLPVVLGVAVGVVWLGAPALLQAARGPARGGA